MQWASLQLLRGVPSGPVSRCLLPAGSLSETLSLCWGLVSRVCVGTSWSNAGDGIGAVRAASASRLPPGEAGGLEEGDGSVLILGRRGMQRRWDTPGNSLLASPWVVIYLKTES